MAARANSLPMSTTAPQQCENGAPRGGRSQHGCAERRHRMHAAAPILRVDPRARGAGDVAVLSGAAAFSDGDYKRAQCALHGSARPASGVDPRPPQSFDVLALLPGCRTRSGLPQRVRQRRRGATAHEVRVVGRRKCPTPLQCLRIGHHRPRDLRRRVETARSARTQTFCAATVFTSAERTPGRTGGSWCRHMPGGTPNRRTSARRTVPPSRRTTREQSPETRRQATRSGIGSRRGAGWLRPLRGRRRGLRGVAWFPGVRRWSGRAWW